MFGGNADQGDPICWFRLTGVLRHIARHNLVVRFAFVDSDQGPPFGRLGGGAYSLKFCYAAFKSVHVLLVYRSMALESPRARASASVSHEIRKTGRPVGLVGSGVSCQTKSG